MDKKRGKKEVSVQGSDAVEGIMAILSIRMQTSPANKDLLPTGVKGIVMSLVYEELMNYFKDNPRAAKTVTDKVINAYTGKLKAPEGIEEKVKSLVTEGLMSSTNLRTAQPKTRKKRKYSLLKVILPRLRQGRKGQKVSGNSVSQGFSLI